MIVYKTQIRETIADCCWQQQLGTCSHVFQLEITYHLNFLEVFPVFFY